MLACRFLPGLRTAIPAACAYAGVKPAKFSSLNMVSALAWASAILATVAWGGPAAMAWIGLKGWWGIAVPAVLILVFFQWLARSTSLPPEDTSG